MTVLERLYDAVCEAERGRPLATPPPLAAAMAEASALILTTSPVEDEAPDWLVYGVLYDYRRASEVQVRGVLAAASRVRRGAGQG